MGLRRHQWLFALAGVLCFVALEGALANGTQGAQQNAANGKNGHHLPPTGTRGHHHHHHANQASQMLARSLTSAYLNPLDDYRRQDLQNSLNRLAGAMKSFNADAKSGEINPNDVRPMQNSLAETLNKNVQPVEHNVLAGRYPQERRLGSIDGATPPAPPSSSISIGITVAPDGAKIADSTIPGAVAASPEVASMKELKGGDAKTSDPKTDREPVAGTAQAAGGVTLVLAAGAAPVVPASDAVNEGKEERPSELAPQTPPWTTGAETGAGSIDESDIDSILDDKGGVVRTETLFGEPARSGIDTLSDAELDDEGRRRKKTLATAVAKLDKAGKRVTRWRRQLASMLGNGNDFDDEPFGSPDFLLFCVPFSMLLLLLLAAYLRLKGKYLRRIYSPAAIVTGNDHPGED